MCGVESARFSLSGVVLLHPPARIVLSAQLVEILVFDNDQRMAGEMDPDVALMLRVKQGDAVAFEQLVEKYKQPVMNLLYRNLRDASEAEDLAQNVFVQV